MAAVSSRSIAVSCSAVYSGGAFASETSNSAAASSNAVLPKYPAMLFSV
jgi:hypothetical protein